MPHGKKVSPALAKRGHVSQICKSALMIAQGCSGWYRQRLYDGNASHMPGLAASHSHMGRDLRPKRTPTLSSSSPLPWFPHQGNWGMQLGYGL